MQVIKKLTRDQAIGAYIGMAVGDAYGAPFEFMHREEIEQFLCDVDWSKPRYFSGGHHNVIEGEWTDDTAMARCIADSYMSYSEADPHQIMTNFHEWMTTGYFGTRTECFDIGGTCARSIQEWKDPRLMQVKEMQEKRQGNGGIMRLGAVICYHSQNYFEAVNDAIYTSHLTHPNDLCDKYAEAVVDRCFSTDLYPSEEKLLGNMREGSGHVRATFWNASYCFTTSSNFLECIQTAVLMGGDTDTTAAVAGMIAGAHYGVSGIPVKLIDDLYDSHLLLAEAEGLYQLGKENNRKSIIK